MTVLAHLQDVRVDRGERPVVHVPSLDIRRGETWALLGPNGAGKTSLLHALGLLLPPAAGELVLFGERVEPGRTPPLALRRRVLTTFQGTLLLDRTALENVALPLLLRGMAHHAARARAREALALFQAEHLAERRATKLSGGEARRVALARGLSPRPDLLLLDEPFAALDPPSREALAGELRQALGATGTTCVAVTHDRQEALALADHVGIVLEGRLAQAGPALDVFRAPASEAVARFVGVENLVPVRVLERGEDTWRLRAAGIELRGTPSPHRGDEALACFRAEDVLLARPGTTGLSARNQVPCTVAAVERGAAGLQVRLQGPFPLVALLSRAAVEELGLAPGTPVVACFKSSAVHLT